MFKVGQKVRVKDLSGESELYSNTGCYFSKEMADICNKEFLISHVYYDGDVEIENGYRLGEEWVELVSFMVECDGELVSDRESIEVAIMQYERQIEKLKRMLEVTDEFKSMGITVKFFNDKMEF